ncbi:hypothetical protein GF412_00985 [Candidatus Micrarchaeota archaeon]|nr:hypothetical protein [Candidatus Micrarchaeota archaeon]MBD3417547.1 hypothetical protein [Candidatus Micrarchaeota archaeon]
MKEFKENEDIQTEEKMTNLNPLSEIPGKVMGVREYCLRAFDEAHKAFGEQMGSDFEKALARLEEADFSVSIDDATHTISTRDAHGYLLSLSVDNDTVSLMLSREGKEDTITYKNGEISRRRQV